MMVHCFFQMFAEFFIVIMMSVYNIIALSGKRELASHMPKESSRCQQSSDASQAVVHLLDMQIL
jgi:hypothetical protein